MQEEGIVVSMSRAVKSKIPEDVDKNGGGLGQNPSCIYTYFTMTDREDAP